MACSLCSCRASHRCFSAASVQEPCWGGGSKRQHEEPHAGQAAAPRLKHRSASGRPCPYKGERGPGVREMGKVLLACAGEGAGKEWHLKGLCLSWAAFARLSQRRHPLPSARCFWPLGALVPAQAQGAVKWGKALPLPSLCRPALALLPQVGCCFLSGLGWQAVPGD